MTTMIERMARAIADKTAEICARTPGDCVAVEVSAPEVARAAIQAMREPTEGMVRAGTDCKVTDPDGWSTCKYELEQIWPAMIDAALAEEPK